MVINAGGGFNIKLKLLNNDEEEQQHSISFESREIQKENKNEMIYLFIQEKLQTPTFWGAQTPSWAHDFF